MDPSRDERCLLYAPTLVTEGHWVTVFVVLPRLLPLDPHVWHSLSESLPKFAGAARV